jgi:hypothetical protein
LKVAAFFEEYQKEMQNLPAIPTLRNIIAQISLEMSKQTVFIFIVFDTWNKAAPG